MSEATPKKGAPKVPESRATAPMIHCKLCDVLLIVVRPDGSPLKIGDLIECLVCEKKFPFTEDLLFKRRKL